MWVCVLCVLNGWFCNTRKPLNGSLSMWTNGSLWLNDSVRMRRVMRKILNYLDGDIMCQFSCHLHRYWWDCFLNVHIISFLYGSNLFELRANYIKRDSTPLKIIKQQKNICYNFTTLKMFRGRTTYLFQCNLPHEENATRLKETERDRNIFYIKV